MILQRHCHAETPGSTLQWLQGAFLYEAPPLTAQQIQYSKG